MSVNKLYESQSNKALSKKKNKLLVSHPLTNRYIISLCKSSTRFFLLKIKYKFFLGQKVQDFFFGQQKYKILSMKEIIYSWAFLVIIKTIRV